MCILHLVSCLKYGLAKSKQRKQHEGETVALFLAELRKIPEACEFKGLLEEVMHDQILFQVQRRLQLEKDIILTKVLQLAQSLEVAIQQIAGSSNIKMEDVFAVQKGEKAMLQILEFRSLALRPVILSLIPG